MAIVREPALIPNAHQIFVVDDAGNLLGAVFIYRDACELVLGHDAQHLFQTRVHRERNNVMSRRHDFARRIVADFDQPLNGALLEILQMPFMPARLHDVFQLFRRVAAVRVPLPRPKRAK